MVNGLSNSPTTKAYGLTLTGGTVADVKFLSADTLLALWCPPGTPPALDGDRGANC